jgi:hypothetical protein
VFFPTDLLSFDPGAKGITISATLNAENSGKTKSGIGSEPKIKDFLTKGELAGAGRGILSNLANLRPSAFFGKDITTKNSNPNKNPASDNIKNNVPQGPLPEGVSRTPEFEVAGSAVFHFTFNEVLAEVGPNAILNSYGDVAVNATLTHKTQQNVEATISRTDDATPDTSISVGLVIGAYQNKAQALVRGKNNISSQETTGPGAVINAKKTLSVTSNISYPWVFPIRDPNTAATDAKNFFGSDPVGRFASFLDGKLGMTGLLFNSWVRTTNKSSSTNASTADFALGLSLAGLGYTNITEAIIESGAKINQDTAFRGSDQAVAVTADTKYELVHHTGNFDIDLSPEGILKSRRKSSFSYLYNASGTQSGGTGIGGAVHVLVVDNTTKAKIENDTQIYFAKAYDPTAKTGGLQVTANTAILNIALGQSGSAAKTFGFAGMVNVDTIFSETIAQIEGGSIITSAAVAGTDIYVDATDTTVMVNLAGSTMKGERKGMGFTGTVNVLNRETYAVIGALPGETQRISTIDIGGELQVKALNTGALISASFAAAIVAPGAASPPPAPSNSKTNNAVQQANQAAPSGDAANQGTYGIGVSADAALNEVVKDFAYAVIDEEAKTNGGKNIRAKKITVTADNDTGLGAFAGAVAAAKSPAGNDIAIAGSFTQNTLIGETKAYINDAVIETETLTVEATRTGVIASLTAGVSVAPGVLATSVAGSVSVNVITNTTTAYLGGLTAMLIGDTKVNARDETLIVSVAGAVGFGGKNGVGAAIAVNVIDNTTKAYVEDSNITQQGGKFEVTSSIDNPGPGNAKIVAITGSVGVSSQGSGLAGMIGVNVIADEAEAYIKNTTFTNPTGTSLSVTAEDNSWIFGIGGAVGVAGQGVGLGAAVGYNGIHSTVRAYLDNADIGTATQAYDGSVLVKADNRAVIGSGTVGAAGSKDTTIAGNVSVNVVTNTTEAYIKGGSNVYAKGAIAVKAQDDSTVGSVSGSLAIGGQGVAIGAALSSQVITNTVKANIDSSTVHSTTSTLEVTADSSSLLIAVALAGSGGQGFAGAGSVTINLIQNTIEASITGDTDLNSDGTKDKSNVQAQESIRVAAADSSTMIVISGAVGVSTNSSAIGGSVSTNNLLNTTTAKIDNSIVTSVLGQIEVKSGFEIPSDAPPTSINLGTTTVAVPEIPSEVTSQVVSVSIGVGVANWTAIAGSVPIK